jgi:tRNA dimethylallyltransferase
MTETSPLLVIVGETGSGKSALAMALARKFNGEIIAGDARTVYRGMDIGTAKPPNKDRLEVAHHLIDELHPGESFTAAQFKVRAQRAIEDIVRRGKLPILVGGSGLYIDSLLYDYAFNAPADSKLRVRLSQLPVVQLQEELKAKGIALPTNERNPRHLIRAIETAGKQASRNAMRPGTLVIGTSVDRELLKQNIVSRIDDMLEKGLEAEVKRLVELYGWNDQLEQTIGYKEFKKYLSGDETIGQVRAAIISHTLAYAKRQRTWFSRNTAIRYPSNLEQSVELVTTWLNK